MPSALLVVCALAPLALGRGGAAAPGAQEPPAAEPQEPAELEPGPEGAARLEHLLQEYAENADVESPFVGLGELPEVEAALAALPANELGTARIDLLRKQSFHEMRLGRLAEAIQHSTEALALAEKLSKPAERRLAQDLRYELALVWLRQGERDNCLARHTSQSCLLPIAGDGVHTDQAGSRKALEILLEIHASRPEFASAAWLANLAAMTVGEWPEAVPEDWRAPPEAFRSEREFPRFPDVAAEWGLADGDLAGGSIAEDFDGDGLIDLATSTWDPRGGVNLYLGRGAGRFEDVTAAWGLAGLPGGLNMVQGDYDNDGDVDLLVLRGAWLARLGRIPKSLLRNDGGRFVDVTYAAGLGERHYPTQAAGFADYDNDGDLDLYVGHESDPKLLAPGQFFQNQGDGTFVERAQELGLENLQFAKGVAWGDYDGDRWPDLYVSNMGVQNRLFRNVEGQRFKNVTPKLDVGAPNRSFATWFFDYDNDGRLDIFVCSYYPILEGFAASHLGWETKAPAPALYRQTAPGEFTLQQGVGIDRPACVMGANFGDLDGDGWLDVYLGTGYPGFDALLPNLMYLNERGERFADVTYAGGFGHLQKGHGVSFADFDGDGDQDLFIQMGGAFADDGFPDALFLNPGFGNASITVRLRGVQSNRFGIGARIHCRVTEGGVQRSIYRFVGSGGSFGSNPLTQTIGLGRAEQVDVLEVYWPTSDTTQRFEDVPTGGSVLAVEFAEELEQ